MKKAYNKTNGLLKAKIQNKIGLDISVGISRNKFYKIIFLLSKTDMHFHDFKLMFKDKMNTMYTILYEDISESSAITLKLKYWKKPETEKSVRKIENIQQYGKN